MSKRVVVQEARGRRDITRRGFLKGTSAAVGVTLAGATLAASGDVAAESQPTLLAGRRPPASMIEVERGVSVHVQDWGAGKPIVLVHGWPSSHRIFERQMLDLARRGYRVVGIDQRGFGKSDTPWHGNDYDTWASDIGAVIKALGLRDVTLAGYSMGGAIAAHYVATQRDPRVTKLVLLSAAGPYLTATDDNPLGMPPEFFDGIIQGVLTDRAGFFHDFMPGMFHSTPSPAYVSWFEEMVTRGSLLATVRGMEEARDRDLRAEFASIEIPTTIIHGVHDQVVPFAFGEEQQRLIAGSTLVPFEQSGHALFFDEAERLSDELAHVAG